ncbi:carboxymuconolactone decarboxylase family protein [Pseudonocardia sp. TRM90224]|uniref:carboxymuconolactone decarboxylase family protein n=1 Tax=Pseudonocardia sp. TRM90224 TaxID=2812678 RepID=UPI001E34A393|nr:carboxymuconolactone decarboxylase family protein [Pseudonocardia sp. TRM90224]
MRLTALRRADLDPEQLALFTSIGASRDLEGDTLPGPFDGMLRAPRSGAALAGLGAALRYEGVLTDRVREIVILQVAAHHRSAFEWYAHAPIAEALGVDPAVLDAIRTGGSVSLTDHVEAAAAFAAAELIASGDLTDGTWEQAVVALGEAGVVELITLVGYYGLLAVQMRVLRVAPPAGAVKVEFGAPSGA